MAWTYSAIPDLSEDQFARWQHVLEERTGIFFSHHKSILQAGLIKRMREIDCLDYEQYFRQLTQGKGSAIEWTALLKTLTVKETSFFRHHESFDYVRKHLFNRLLSGEAGESASIEIWSVGCSTGEEPYSLAMVANDCIEGLGLDAYFGVTASDICLSALASSRKAVYLNRKLEGVDPALRERYFEKENDTHHRVVNWLRQRVCFVQTNLIELNQIPLADMDVIFCQNVLIYFRRWRQKEILNALVERLKPGGLLVVGIGEAIGWEHSQLRRVAEETVQAYVRV